MKISWISAALGACLAAGAVTGCMTGQNQTTLDAITGSSTQPYVEAFIEYRGPAERWAGPSNWVMHVVAKDGEKPEVTVPAAWMNDTSEARKPASQLISGEEARAELGDLATALSATPDASFHGCMYPVHVRMIRADGFVLDKQGCRNQSRWAKTASGAVDFFLATVK